MRNYLKNTILNYDRKTVDGYSVSDYLSKNIPDTLEYIDSLDSSFFSWHQVQNNDSIERIAHELYGNADYWDILLLVNHKNPLTQMPYHYDAIYETAESEVQTYIDDVYGDLPQGEHNILLEAISKELTVENEEFRIMKIVAPSKINTFLQKGFEDGYF